MRRSFSEGSFHYELCAALVALFSLLMAPQSRAQAHLDQAAPAQTSSNGLASMMVLSPESPKKPGAEAPPNTILSDKPGSTNSAEAINEALAASQQMLATTNLHPLTSPNKREQQLQLQRQRLEMARNQRLFKQFSEARANFIELLESDAPDQIKRTALLELAFVAQEENDLPKAQQILAQFVARWPQDPSVPEIFLRQGIIFRQMGLNQSAIGKFYAVMTSALTVKTTQLDYYQRLVLQAQTEIAETHYLQGKFTEATDSLTRLLKLDSSALNRGQILFKLIRSLSSLHRDEDVIVRSLEFLDQFPDGVEEAEVRFCLATALKRSGRNSDSLQQVLLLLQKQQNSARAHPETLAYWQQRTGNEIANHLYQEGDFLKALQIYLSLVDLNPSPSWKLPVEYQVGLVYERLEQPAKAIETYTRLLGMEKQIGTNAPPGVKAILDMANWRKDFLTWTVKGETANRDLQKSLAPTESAASGVAENPVPKL
jgi:tetratricopeptide (TPR) repeat protein